MRLLVLAVLIALASPSAAAPVDDPGDQPSEMKFDYDFEGTLKVAIDSSNEELEGVQVRVVRQKGGVVGVGKGVGRKKFETDSNGEFDFTVKFARDRDGIGPFHKDIRFEVQARFRNSDLKVRKGGWAKNNWFTIAKVQGKAKAPARFDTKSNFPLGDLIFNDDSESHALDDQLPGRHAQIWWYYTKALDRLDREGVGLPNRFVVTYPHKKAFTDKNTGHAGAHAFLGADDHPGDPDGPRTMMHELMHVWHKQNMRGGANPKCWFDKHHKAPKSTGRAAQCSGLMEGLAGAGSYALLHEVYGESWQGMLTHDDLRNGNIGQKPSYKVTDRDEAQRSDVGWQNYLSLLWRNGEWGLVGCSSTSRRDPNDIGFFRVLEILKNENMKISNQTFDSFGKTLQNNETNFTSDDVETYKKLGDPSTTKDGCSLSSSTGPLTEASTDFSGTWTSSFGELELHQVNGYVVGDYADKGVLVGKVSGSCVAGVFTNGDRNGVFRFNASGSGEFDGAWAWSGESLDGSWRGSRTSETAREFDNFTRDGSTTRVNDNDRSVFDGTYDSSFGELELMARDLVLVGDYGDKGILAGMWDGNSFVGHFTNGDRTGWFDLAFFSRNGSFRSGEWGWIGDGSSGSWSLTEASGQTPTPRNMLDDVSCN